MDDIERAAIAAEGYDPDDPAVVAALARVTARRLRSGQLHRDAARARLTERG